MSFFHPKCGGIIPKDLYFLWAITLRVNNFLVGENKTLTRGFFSPLQFVPLHRGTKMSWCLGETPSIPLFFISIFVNSISKIEFLQRAIHALPCHGSSSSSRREARESWVRISFLYSFQSSTGVPRIFGHPTYSLLKKNRDEQAMVFDAK